MTDAGIVHSDWLSAGLVTEPDHRNTVPRRKRLKAQRARLTDKGMQTAQRPGALENHHLRHPRGPAR